MAGGGRATSFLTRFAVAMMAGLMLGILGLAILPAFLPDLDPLVRWGFFLWYPTVAGIIALAAPGGPGKAGRIVLPWWLRATAIGAWMNFVAILLAPEVMRAFMRAAFGEGGLLASPFWFVAEGAGAGLVIGYLVMRFAAEGRGIADD